MAEEVPKGTFKGLEGHRCAFIAILGRKEEMVRDAKDAPWGSSGFLVNFVKKNVLG
jgi:hypothetical protein